jgi:uncharacterized delta-60 repeat protein
MTTQSTNSDFNGKLDPDFGPGGVAYFKDMGLPLRAISSRACASDGAGSYYIVGAARDFNNESDYICIKLRPDGSPDKDFGNGGYVSGHSDTDLFSSIAYDVKLLSDKKILIIGNYRDNKDVGVLLIQLKPDGTLDSEFGSEGKVILKPSDFDGASNPKPAAILDERLVEIRSTAITPDGKIVLLTQYRTDDGTVPVIIRLLSNGAFDVTFNKKGFVEAAHPDANNTTQLHALLLTVDGKLLVAGTVGHAFFMQINDNGSTDTGFGKEGYLVVIPDSSQRSIIYRLIQQKDKRFLGIGENQDAESRGLLISREANGSENIEFNDGDPVMERLGGSFTVFSDGQVNDDGSIYTLGIVQVPGEPTSSTALARFNHAGKIDPKYADNKGYYVYRFPNQIISRGDFTPRKLTFFSWTTDGREEHQCIVRGLTD